MKSVFCKLNPQDLPFFRSCWIFRLPRLFCINRILLEEKTILGYLAFESGAYHDTLRLFFSCPPQTVVERF